MENISRFLQIELQAGCMIWETMVLLCMMAQILSKAFQFLKFRTVEYSLYDTACYVESQSFVYHSIGILNPQYSEVNIK
jgi:hypothetical protein